MQCQGEREKFKVADLHSLILKELCAGKMCGLIFWIWHSKDEFQGLILLAMDPKLYQMSLLPFLGWAKRKSLTNKVLLGKC